MKNSAHKTSLRLLLLSFLISGSLKQARASDCVECGSSGISSPYFLNRDNPIGLLINDFMAKKNRLKTPEKIEQYHRCLLSGKQERLQEKSYASSYRHLIVAAAQSFDVPIAMLTCLCGRESRFNASAQNAEGTAKGICQAMNGSLKDVERWRNQVPELKQQWEDYIQRLGKRLEDPACARQPLSHQVLIRCPSLGLGAASVYLRYVYSKVEGRNNFHNLIWDSQSLQTLVTVAGSYFSGAGFAERALKKAPGRDGWTRALMREVCVDAREKHLSPDWAKTRMSELRNHMSAIRNCVQEDNWLDHQGNPLRGECKMDLVSEARQIKDFEAFRAGIPANCTFP